MTGNGGKGARRLLGTVSAVLALGLTSFALAGNVPHSLAAPAAAGNAGTLIIAYHQAPTDLDPFSNYDSPAAAVLRGCYDTLVRLRGKSTTQIEGDLATSWSSSQGGKVWTFHLRHGVHFHDGSLLTARAVKLSMDRNQQVNQGPAFIESTFVSPSGIQVVNPYTIRFHLKFASDVFLRALAAQWGNWIVSPKAINKPHTWFQSHDAGTGPYILSKIVPGQSETLVRYNKYWGGWKGKHLSKIIINIVTEDATRRELIEKGGADLTETLTPDDLVALAKDPNVRVDKSYGMTNVSLVMTEAGPLKTAAARRAMAYAFDYNGLIHGVLKGYGRESQGPLPRTFLGHDFSLPIYHTNLPRARALLKQAGVKAGTKMTLWYQAEDVTTRNIALIMQAQLAQLGISLQLVSRDATTLVDMYYGNTPAAQRPNFFVWYWYPDYNDPGDWLFPQYDSAEKGSSGSNGGFYHNSTVDRLLVNASKMAKTSARLKLYNQVQKIVTWT